MHFEIFGFSQASFGLECQCKQTLAGNICCCGTFPQQSTAIIEATPVMKGDS
jgi:hypothetical protein